MLTNEEKKRIIWDNSSPHRRLTNGAHYVMQPGNPPAWVNLETASDTKLDDMLPIEEVRHERLSLGEYDRQARQARVTPIPSRHKPPRAPEHERERIINLEQRAIHLEQRISHLEDIIDYIVGISDVWRDRWTRNHEE